MLVLLDPRGQEVAELLDLGLGRLGQLGVHHLAHAKHEGVDVGERALVVLDRQPGERRVDPFGHVG